MTDQTTEYDDIRRWGMLWYEGSEDAIPSFLADIRRRHGFDPSTDPRWDSTKVLGRPECGFACPNWDIREAIHDDPRYWELPWPIGC